MSSQESGQRHRNAKSRTKSSSRSTAGRARADYSTKSGSSTKGRAAHAPKPGEDSRESTRAHNGRTQQYHRVCGLARHSSTGRSWRNDQLGRQALKHPVSALRRLRQHAIGGKGAKLRCGAVRPTRVSVGAARAARCQQSAQQLQGDQGEDLAQADGAQLAKACLSQCAPDSQARSRREPGTEPFMLSARSSGRGTPRARRSADR